MKMIRALIRHAEPNAEQRAQLKSIRQEAQTAMRALHKGEPRGMHDALLTLLASDSFDEAAFTELEERRQGRHAERQAIVRRSLREAFEVLSVEQRPRAVTAIRAKRAQRKKAAKE